MTIACDELVAATRGVPVGPVVGDREEGAKAADCSGADLRDRSLVPTITIRGEHAVEILPGVLVLGTGKDLLRMQRSLQAEYDRACTRDSATWHQPASRQRSRATTVLYSAAVSSTMPQW